MDIGAAIAFSRFGLGRRRDEPVPREPRTWLLQQLQGPDPYQPSADLPNTAQALAMVAAEMATEKSFALADPDHKKGASPEQKALIDMHRRERDAFLANALTTNAGFRERLVWFWANHFTIAARTRPSTACAGAYVREAIRPYVTGKFSDMLLAVMRHPAMLAYLDQAKSVGPNSIAGQRHHEGLNENLARECLELHTVTPASGYTQADVTSFAKLLTGWSFDGREQPYGFRFRPNAHEPGEQTIMGHIWPDGEEGGVVFLNWLANHPNTHRHLAQKLVCHFVSDTPAPHDVTRIEAVLRDTNGDLLAATTAVVDLSSAWVPLTKIRSPQDYVVATMRAVGAHPDAEPHLIGTLDGLGQPLFRAPFPIGWPDRAEDWASPEAMLLRADFAYQFAGRVTDQEPMQVAENTLGPLLSDATATEIRHAGARRDALALFLASPEFQRR